MVDKVKDKSHEYSNEERSSQVKEIGSLIPQVFKMIELCLRLCKVKHPKYLICRIHIFLGKLANGYVKLVNIPGYCCADHEKHHVDLYLLSVDESPDILHRL